MPRGNDIAVHLLVDPPHGTFAKVGAAVYHGGHAIIVARTSRCARALPPVPVPTAALIPSLGGAAHRRTALPQARSLSGSRLWLGLPKRFQSFLRLHAHPDPILRPAPLRRAMDVCSHIYPSSDPVLTPPLRVRPCQLVSAPASGSGSSCSSSSYGAPFLALSPPPPPAYWSSPPTPPPRSARAGPPRPSPPSTQRTAARVPRRPSPSGATSPARAPPRNPSPIHPSPVLHRAPWAASPSCLRRSQASRVDGSFAPVISIRVVIVHSTSRPRIQ
ncbi:hypothetical protein B0H14DRAFT_919320 [Mycena olivaceomarginata]|nr:hypothetical protein B0H14DRAFT_919320 [Mycena olivaceomarginata]